MKRINRMIRYLELIIINALIVMMAIVLMLATVELGYYLVGKIIYSDYFLISLDGLMDLFGIFLLVLIGIELLDTIKVYLRENVIHVEVVVLVAIIALARKVVILNIEEMEGLVIIGIGLLIASLSLAYYLIKKAGLLVIDCNSLPKEIKKEIKDEVKEKIDTYHEQIIQDEKDANDSK